LNVTPMLSLDVVKIPPEGLDVDEALEKGEVHLEGEHSFSLEEGGRLRCHVERGDNHTVHVQGHLGATLTLECSRCLSPYSFPVQQELELFYLPHEEEAEEEDEVGLDDRDMVVAYYRDDRLDLGEMVREQFFLATPLKTLCREDCKGLCPTCGANRNLVACACPQTTDPRFQSLSSLLGKGSS
jgi:uncharacterized protein